VTDPGPTHVADGLGGAAGGPVSTVIPIEDESNVGAARRGAAALSTRAGLGETERGAFAVIVTEAATNLARHAKEGLLALRVVGTPPDAGVEVLALDRSPGIHDINRALTDGYSTSGTAGHGLGAIRRMASEFDIYSNPDGGTALLARIWPHSRARPRGATCYTDGVVCLPQAGEWNCGDGWSLIRTPNGVQAVVVDGLGHGAGAARAADEALRIVRECEGWSPARTIEAAHGPLRATRGAAIAVAEIVASEQLLRFAGIGNISGTIVTRDASRSLASYNGTVGAALRKVKELTYPWPDGACLLMHSDGITSRARPDAYPGLVERHPAILAGVIFRDFYRGRDDATVLVVRERGE
jgi:Anti-sigma regulatory factor (Ser/Thr protein kinase)